LAKRSDVVESTAIVSNDSTITRICPHKVNKREHSQSLDINVQSIHNKCSLTMGVAVPIPRYST
jgi:hypothetical protein